MKNFKSLIFVIIILGSISSCNSPFGDRFVNNFMINDTLSVVSIKISGNNDLLLSRTEKGWIIDETYLANQVAVNNFLFSLTRLEKLAVLNSFENSNSQWTKFEIDTNNKKLSFSFCYQDGVAFLRNDKENEVYRFGLKGLNEVDLSTIFSDNLSHWQNPSLLNFSSDEISEISVMPNAEWGSPFKMMRIEGNWALHTMDGVQENIDRVDKEKLAEYSTFFSGIYFDKEIERKNFKKSFDPEDEFYTFRIKNTSDKETIIIVYQHVNELGEYDDFNAIMSKSGSQNLFFVNYIYLDLMFETYESFLVN